MNGNESLMDLFKDPETIHSLSMGEKLLGSTIAMVLGLGITFITVGLMAMAFMCFSGLKL